ncbi:hypothetical protein G5C51_04410 [Streptomyces sp. A7024]|uniref:Uncharacterized protein n=1 Tax=Streptomyces coryli TaxID=1128680 RepID=A0A6G4TUC7_9ACTN|nr:hypothetical protein [Streptomyces coryli]NGN63150.1 hypothetical protein [Streptomyces coryli]
MFRRVSAALHHLMVSMPALVVTPWAAVAAVMTRQWIGAAVLLAVAVALWAERLRADAADNPCIGCPICVWSQRRDAAGKPERGLRIVRARTLNGLRDQAEQAEIWHANWRTELERAESLDEELQVARAPLPAHPQRPAAVPAQRDRRAGEEL